MSGGRTPSGAGAGAGAGKAGGAGAGKGAGTPATVALTAAGIAFTAHAYEHHDTATNFGEEAALASTTVASAVRCPTGLMPPTT